MKPQDFSKQLKEYSTEMEAIKHQGIIAKPTKAEDQIQRLLNTDFYTPFDVLQLRSNATEDDMKKQYRAFSFLLHPDKCKDPKAKDAFHVIQRSYKTILDPAKRDVDLRIMRQARQRAVFQRKRQNDKRIKNGQNPLEESTFEEYYHEVIQKTFKEIQNQRQNIRKIQLSNHTKKMDDLETKKMVQQYKVLTQEEWQRSRDKRVSNWRQFSKKKFVVGSKKSDGSIRPPPVRPQSRPDYTTVDDKKKNL